MSRQTIPVLRTNDRQLAQVLEALTHNLNKVTGAGKNAERVEPLAGTASSTDIIALLNQLVARVNCE
jgi:hypothetical protein